MSIGLWHLAGFLVDFYAKSQLQGGDGKFSPQQKSHKLQICLRCHLGFIPFYGGGFKDAFPVDKEKEKHLQYSFSSGNC